MDELMINVNANLFGQLHNDESIGKLNKDLKGYFSSMSNISHPSAPFISLLYISTAGHKVISNWRTYVSTPL